jgi:2-polyprenyl-6-methoxyphenol hydroxylase-like FAD-dependent oxidoreductase
MHSPPSLLHDVVIVGAGPVGLFLACEMRLANLSVLVLEQSEEATSPLKRLPFGMRGLSAPTLEALYRRGLLEDVMQAHSSAKVTAANAHWMQQAQRPAGHFAGIQFYPQNIDASRWTYRLPSPAGTSFAVEMQHLEAVLEARAICLGVEIKRGVRVEDLDQLDSRVVVRAGNQTFCGRWLVGCDGGRSAVRKAAGFSFDGTEPEFTGYSLEVEIADPQMLSIGRQYTPTCMYTYTRPGTIAMVQFDGGALHRTQEITLEHVQSVLRAVSCTDVTITALRLATTWTDRAYQATTYRNGRVLLAGDAAHIHSPLGGQGLNLGLGDAMNLGWKLAATIKGSAPHDLLDSYTSERHPIGESILDWSRAQVALMRPTPSTRALQSIVRDLIDTRDGSTYFAERVWGVSLCYNFDNGHPLVGRSVPDFELVDGTRTGDLLKNAQGVLLDFDGSESLRDLSHHWRDRIVYVQCAAKERLGLSAVLVRPDGFVAWASEHSGECEDAWPAALRWFGEPSQSA